MILCKVTSITYLLAIGRLIPTINDNKL